MDSKFYSAISSNVLVCALVGTNWIDAKLFSVDHPESFIDFYAKFQFKANNDKKLSLVTISIVDLIGNGPGSNLNNKGYGSILVSSVFNIIKIHFDVNSTQQVKIVGTISDSGDNGVIDHHLRRVHFWKKMGLTVIDENNKFSGISGNLNEIPLPAIPFESFSATYDKNIGQLQYSSFNRAINLIPWSESDSKALSQIKGIDFESIIIERAKTEAEYEVNNKQISKLVLAEFKLKFSVACFSFVFALLSGLDNNAVILFGIPLVFYKLTGFLTNNFFLNKRIKISSMSSDLFSQINSDESEVVEYAVAIDRSRFGLLIRAYYAKKIRLPEQILSQLDKCKLLSKVYINNDNAGSLLSQIEYLD